LINFCENISLTKDSEQRDIGFEKGVYSLGINTGKGMNQGEK
jgi:hypothetical protein